MDGKLVAIIGILVAALVGCGAARLRDWDLLSSETFDLYCPEGRDREAQELLNTLELSYPAVERLTGGHLSHIPVVLEDLGMRSSGFADIAFQNIHISTYVPQEGSLYPPCEDWWRLVTVHELTHQLHLRHCGGTPKQFATIAGFPLLPQIYTPGWLIEGFAVLSESTSSPFEGRLNDGMFRAYVDTRQNGDAFPSLSEATYSPTGFPGPAGIYIYGAEFFRYLVTEYGESSLRQFLNFFGARISSYISPAVPALGMDRAARETFGKPFPALWDDWRVEFKSAEQPVHQPLRISSIGELARKPVVSGDMLFYQRTLSFKVAPLQTWTIAQVVKHNLSTKQNRVVASTTSAFTGPLRVCEDRLYYQVREMRRGFANLTERGFGVVSVLHAVDLRTGTDKILIEGRIGTFDVLPDGSLIYAIDRCNCFGSEVWMYDPSNDSVWLLFSTNLRISELVYNRNELIVVAKEQGKNCDIYSVELSSGEWQPLVSSPWFEGYISLCDDYLLFTATYNGSYEIYRYDLSTRAIDKSAVLGYAVEPTYYCNRDRLFFVGLNVEGYAIYSGEPSWEHFEVPSQTQSSQSSPCEASIDKATALSGAWLQTLIPTAHIPLITWLPEKGLSLAFLGVGSDVLELVSYWFLANWSFRESKPALQGQLNTRLCSPLEVQSEFNFGDDRAFHAVLKYPVVRQMQQGLTKLDVSFFLSMNQSEDWLLAAGTSVEGCLGFVNGNIRLGISVEDTEPGALIASDSYAISSTLRIEQMAYQGTSSLEVMMFHGSSTSGDSFAAVRGYDEPLVGNDGFVCKAECVRPVIEVRKGTWNPSLFFEDFFLGGFFDFASLGTDTQASIGVKASIEVGLLFWLKAAPGLVLTITKDGMPSLQLTLEGWVAL